MRVLVDTHCWLWALARPEALNPAAASLLGDAETEVLFSAASVWEIAIKSSLGKVMLPEGSDLSLFDILDSLPMTSLPVFESHARQVAKLPLHHRDPFDRLLIAQAQVEDLPILTADEQFLDYEVELIWAARRPPRRRRRSRPRPRK
ncbi:MAG TPA: type II toxin-antitoxin system VapC family toxin [Thermoanaerobaculia bacterium]|nr:type II toxin-antitoxin system VapC family toxin [Thermoanaerobaculia bacterium]